MHHYTPRNLTWKALLFGVFFALQGGNALAAALVNLSNETQTIEIKTHEGYAPQLINVGETFRVSGALDMRLDGRDIRIDDDMEFAFWPNGVFGPQKKYKTIGSGF